MSDDSTVQVERPITITLVNPETGELGAVVSGLPSDIAPMVTGPFIEGAFDGTTHRVDIDTRQLVELPPRAPLLHELRQARNEMLDTWRWTVMPDSPLTESNIAQWLTWLRALHVALKDVGEDQTAGFAWPHRPDLIYASGNEE